MRHLSRIFVPFVVHAVATREKSEAGQYKALSEAEKGGLKKLNRVFYTPSFTYKKKCRNKNNGKILKDFL